MIILPHITAGGVSISNKHEAYKASCNDTDSDAIVGDNLLESYSQQKANLYILGFHLSSSNICILKSHFCLKRLDL